MNACGSQTGWPAVRAGLLVLLLVGSGGCQAILGPSPGRIARVERSLEHRLADERRHAINWLVKHRFGRREPYLTHYRQMAAGDREAEIEADRDHLVRAVAVRALNRARDRASVPVFIEALADEEHLVRLEGAKALNNVPDREAVPLLLARLRDPDEHLDVRIAAAEALRHYPRFEVMSALMDLLLHRQFGLAWQARQSLIHLTGQDHRYDIPAWRAHLAS